MKQWSSLLRPPPSDNTAMPTANKWKQQMLSLIWTEVLALHQCLLLILHRHRHRWTRQRVLLRNRWAVRPAGEEDVDVDRHGQVGQDVVVLIGRGHGLM